jgi:hypothetical protein
MAKYPTPAAIAVADLSLETIFEKTSSMTISQRLHPSGLPAATSFRFANVFFLVSSYSSISATDFGNIFNIVCDNLEINLNYL